MSTTPTAISATQYCTFELEGLLFGIDVTAVQEVIRYQPMTPVPLAPSMVVGLINLRGQIVTAIDLRARLELGPRENTQLPMNVVVRTDDSNAVSLLVDKIGDVIDVDPADFELPPDTVKGVARELIIGAYKLDGRLLLALDVNKTMNLTGVVSSTQGEVAP